MTGQGALPKPYAPTGDFVEKDRYCNFDSCQHNTGKR